MESFEWTQSRKQDRNGGLLGWWVCFFLVLLSSAWKPILAAEVKILEKDGRGAEASRFNRSPSLSKMHFGVNALSAPTSPERRVYPIDRSRVDPQLLKSAEGMEAMFLDFMLKTMRQTIPKNPMDLESPATDIYRSMLDSSLAEKAAHRGGIGLADQLIAYLQSQGYNERQGQGVPKKEKP